MNEYIKAQIMNMTTIVRTFAHSCQMAAQKNDGKIDAEEEKQLKKINKASENFIKQLNKIK